MNVGGETAEEFLQRSGLSKILEHIYVSVCRERPDDAEAYLVEYLTSYHAKSAKSSVAHRTGVLKGGKFRDWKPKEATTNKVDLERYLDDVRLSSLLQRIVEKALMVRSDNVVSLAIDLACGTDAHLQDEQEAELAAQKLQARQRGNNMRKERREQNQAATKVQAKARGRKARKPKKQPAPITESEEVAVSMGD